MLFLWCFCSASEWLFSGQLPFDVDPADEQGDERCEHADQYAPVERLSGAVQDNRTGERRDAVAAQKYVDPFKLSPQLLGRMGACVWSGFSTVVSVGSIVSLLEFGFHDLGIEHGTAQVELLAYLGCKVRCDRSVFVRLLD